jgi:hypothetical protein
MFYKLLKKMINHIWKTLWSQNSLMKLVDALTWLKTRILNWNIWQIVTIRKKKNKKKKRINPTFPNHWSLFISKSNIFHNLNRTLTNNFSYNENDLSINIGAKGIFGVRINRSENLNKPIYKLPATTLATRFLLCQYFRLYYLNFSDPISIFRN